MLGFLRATQAQNQILGWVGKAILPGEAFMRSFTNPVALEAVGPITTIEADGQPVVVPDCPRRGHFSTTPSRPNEHTAQNGRSAGVSNFTPNIQWVSTLAARLSARGPSLPSRIASPGRDGRPHLKRDGLAKTVGFAAGS